MAALRDEANRLWPSQWSLTFEVRKRWRKAVGLSTPQKSQWSLTFEVRKRIDPLRDGAAKSRSQWSLTFEVRKRPCDALLRAWDMAVAMEPDL